MASHRELILMHMKKYGSITQDEAKAEYGCARLASRINELRKQGVAIKTDMVDGVGKHGKISYAKYSLAEVGQ